jgi:hypothetical protein
MKIPIGHSKETVYRYRPINQWLERILVRNELFFAPPEAFNDPWDCRCDVSAGEYLQGLDTAILYEKTVGELHELLGESYNSPLSGRVAPDRLAKMSQPEIVSLAQEIYADLDLGNPEKQQARQHQMQRNLDTWRKHLGVCCFAGRGDNMLMHSHYADQHRGCCLEFQIRNDKGNRESIFEEPKLEFEDVVYKDEVPSVQLYYPITLVIKKMLLTKLSSWKYEEEVRVIRFKGAGPVRFKREALTGVIFGCNVHAQSVKRVLDWLGTTRGVKFSMAVLDRASGLRLEPM